MLQMEASLSIFTVIFLFMCSLDSEDFGKENLNIWGVTIFPLSMFSVKEVEHLDWNARTRIIMGTAYCLQYMHELNPPVAHSNLTSAAIYLTDDYAAKVHHLHHIP